MKNHWDTIAIIGVNLAIAGLLMALCISNTSQICNSNARFEAHMTAANSRIDTLHVMFYDLLREKQNK